MGVPLKLGTFTIVVTFKNSIHLYISCTAFRTLSGWVYHTNLEHSHSYLHSKLAYTCTSLVPFSVHSLGGCTTQTWNIHNCTVTFKTSIHLHISCTAFRTLSGWVYCTNPEYISHNGMVTVKSACTCTSLAMSSVHSQRCCIVQTWDTTFTILKPLSKPATIGTPLPLPSVHALWVGIANKPICNISNTENQHPSREFQKLLIIMTGKILRGKKNEVVSHTVHCSMLRFYTHNPDL